jgi:hypothetical protein
VRSDRALLKNKCKWITPSQTGAFEALSEDAALSIFDEGEKFWTRLSFCSVLEDLFRVFVVEMDYIKSSYF